MAKSKILALDTSTNFCSAEVVVDGLVRSQACGVSSSRHNEEIEEIVGRVLQDADLTPLELDELLIGSGPGSFTGLRIGYSFVMGLSVAVSIPVYQISSFLGVAVQFMDRFRLVVVSSDARRGELFAGVYFFSKERDLEIVLEPQVLTSKSLTEKMNDWQENFQLEDSSIGLISLDGQAYTNARFCEDQCNAIAGGLAKVRTLGSTYPGFSQWAAVQREPLKSLECLEPDYVREVFARTIEQREVDKSTAIE